MIELLNNKYIPEMLELLKKYHATEDKNCEIVLNRDQQQLEELILNGYVFGKHKNKKLIGFASLLKYNAINALNKTNSENRIRKERFFDENDINDKNTALLLNDLIDIDYRGESLYKELILIRLDKIRELGYEHVVEYININKVQGINDFLKNGWKFGTLIKISKNRYEILLHFKI